MRSKPARKSGWKVAQNKSKNKKITRLALAVLGLILAVIILGNLIRFTQTLFNSWKIEDTKKYTWNDQFNINLAVKSNLGIYVITYIPQEKKIIFIKVPGSVLVEVPEGFGSWQIRSVYELGENNQEGEGATLLKSTLVSLLGIPIDGFLELSSFEDITSSDQIIPSIQKNVLLSLDDLNSIKSTLTLWDLIRLKLAVSSVRFDKIETIDLSDILDQGQLADGTQILKADQVRVDSIASDLADPKMKEEQKTIAIFNTTQRAGLASKASRMITNMGGNVIITANSTQKLDKTYVFGEKSQTYDRLSQVFNSICQSNAEDCDKIRPQVEEAQSSRAQINIFLGEDF